MEWLILRMHRMHVKRFGPVTADLSNLIRAVNEFRKNDRALRAKMKEIKAEGRRFNDELNRLKAETKEFDEKFNQLVQGTTKSPQA